MLGFELEASALPSTLQRNTGTYPLPSCHPRSNVKSHSLDLHPLSQRPNSLFKFLAPRERLTFPMKTIRPQVQAFVRATETLLSPIILGRPLNEDERDMVAMCVQSLAEKYPMSLTIPGQYRKN